MAPPARIVIKDKGFTKFFARLKRLGKPGFQISVGVHEEENQRDPPANPQGKELLTMATLAAIHEYGVETEQVSIPERSFLRSWYDERKVDVEKAIFATSLTLLTGGEDERKALERLAHGFAGEVQTKIRDGIPPALAQSTIDAKGSSKPLIDTGQLRQSIRGKVHR